MSAFRVITILLAIAIMLENFRKYNLLGNPATSVDNPTVQDFLFFEIVHAEYYLRSVNQRQSSAFCRQARG